MDLGLFAYLVLAVGDSFSFLRGKEPHPGELFDLIHKFVGTNQEL